MLRGLKREVWQEDPRGQQGVWGGSRIGKCEQEAVTLLKTSREPINPGLRCAQWSGLGSHTELVGI